MSSVLDFSTNPLRPSSSEECRKQSCFLSASFLVVPHPESPPLAAPMAIVLAVGRRQKGHRSSAISDSFVKRAKNAFSIWLRMSQKRLLFSLPF
jgi:hypothetical protein